MAKDYKDWTIEEIGEWCKANNQVEWLKTLAKKKVEKKVYPKVESVSKNGKKSWKADKTAEPTIEMVKISFVEIKSTFISTFIETEPKQKKPSMYDYIESL